MTREKAQEVRNDLIEIARLALTAESAVNIERADVMRRLIAIRSKVDKLSLTYASE